MILVMSPYFIISNYNNHVGKLLRNHIKDTMESRLFSSLYFLSVFLWVLILDEGTPICEWVYCIFI